MIGGPEWWFLRNKSKSLRTVFAYAYNQATYARRALGPQPGSRNTRIPPGPGRGGVYQYPLFRLAQVK